ncbi:response regulator transcription factor [Emticicia sp. BO119]|uniref:response regulator n=1 Tax=Emticicia sp. BO119 TaxID=2757768 RepID=UPI0015F1063D|nr:response regulator transcription factor [Emticicia sp. BO119]MBA4848864.1 response regulator transcription factor [Emticicia sp. BO119]
MINLIIADDHNVFVEGIESLLSRNDDLKVVGRCYTVEAVKDCLLQFPADIILLDISFPRVEDGLLLYDYILHQHQSLKVIFLTMHDELSIVKRVMRKGGQGYLLKNTSKAELVQAIQAVYDGKKYINAFIRKLMETHDKKARKSAFIPIDEIRLSPREKEVLFLISEGYTTQQMATKLFVTLKAIEFHRSSLLVKFDVPNTALLIKTALEMNYL